MFQLFDHTVTIEQAKEILDGYSINVIQSMLVNGIIGIDLKQALMDYLKGRAVSYLFLQ
mgnify:FL=1